jgi:nucleotide-binding universal stress UspA family protein
VAHIIVGVDGSQASRAALGWAVRHADAGTAEVRAVHAWDAPAVGSEDIGMLIDRDELERQARRELDDVVDAVAVASPSTAAPRIERVLRQGPAAECLLHDAAGADLVVLGARGLDAADRSPLGRVGRHVLAAATCPVVVVPTETTTGAGGPGDRGPA